MRLDPIMLVKLLELMLVNSYAMAEIDVEGYITLEQGKRKVLYSWQEEELSWEPLA